VASRLQRPELFPRGTEVPRHRGTRAGKGGALIDFYCYHEIPVSDRPSDPRGPLSAANQSRGQSGWLKLAKSLAGELDGFPVTILDVADDRLLLEQKRAAAAGGHATVRFRWDRFDLELRCQVSAVKPGYWSEEAHHFMHETEMRVIVPNEMFSTLISEYRNRVLMAQEANASGAIERNVVDDGSSIVDLGAARRRRMTGFVVFRWVDGRWQRRTVQTPEQPADGFTLSALEDEDQMRLLCLAYEEADEEGRRLLRDFAALSVQELVAADARRDRMLEV
jgi:hypothetical protein